MPKEMGKYVFLIGFAIAILAGLVGATGVLGATADYIALILVLLGILVGFLNITATERQSFLIAVIALSMLGLVSFGALTFVGAYLTSVISYLITFVAPAAAIVALFAIYDLARS